MRIGYSNDSLKRKCEEQGKVHKQGRGVRRARGNEYATASPLTLLCVLRHVLHTSFQRVVGTAYPNSACFYGLITSRKSQSAPTRVASLRNELGMTAATYLTRM